MLPPDENQNKGATNVPISSKWKLDYQLYISNRRKRSVSRLHRRVQHRIQLCIIIAALVLLAVTTFLNFKDGIGSGMGLVNW